MLIIRFDRSNRPSEAAPEACRPPQNPSIRIGRQQRQVDQNQQVRVNCDNRYRLPRQSSLDRHEKQRGRNRQRLPARQTNRSLPALTLPAASRPRISQREARPREKLRAEFASALS